MLKASSYQMVEENSKYNDSYFYQIDHPSRKSLFNAIQLLYRAPYVEQDKGLPGKIQRWQPWIKLEQFFQEHCLIFRGVSRRRADVPLQSAHPDPDVQSR